MEFKDTQSIYLQIVDYICEQILLDRWKVDERIPSVRDLAALVEVNPNTAMRAYDFLQQKDIIYNKRGIGYFVAESGKNKIMNFRKERFIETELPEFFKLLYLLNINIDEVENRYKDFIKNNYS